AACAIGACLFLVAVDGSRTGVLLIGVMFLSVGMILWWRRDGALLRRRPWVVPLAVGALLALLLLNAGMSAWKHGLRLPAGAPSSQTSQVEALVGKALAPVMD